MNKKGKKRVTKVKKTQECFYEKTSKKWRCVVKRQNLVQVKNAEQYM